MCISLLIYKPMFWYLCHILVKLQENKISEKEKETIQSENSKKANEKKNEKEVVDDSESNTNNTDGENIQNEENDSKSFQDFEEISVSNFQLMMNAGILMSLKFLKILIILRALKSPTIMVITWGFRKNPIAWISD